MSKLKSLIIGSLLFVQAAFAANPITVPPGLAPKLDPIKEAFVVTCQYQLVFVLVVFDDGKVTVYDPQSGVPPETALYTADQAKSKRGYEVCVNTGSAHTSLKA